MCWGPGRVCVSRGGWGCVSVLVYVFRCAQVCVCVFVRVWVRIACIITFAKMIANCICNSDIFVWTTCSEWRCLYCLSFVHLMKIEHSCQSSGSYLISQYLHFSATLNPHSRFFFSQITPFLFPLSASRAPLCVNFLGGVYVPLYVWQCSTWLAFSFCLVVVIIFSNAVILKSCRDVILPCTTPVLKVVVTLFSLFGASLTVVPYAS